jgi:hypothetical protein
VTTYGAKVVQQAVERPFRCAILPFIGNSNASGWIDTGQRLELEKIYVSFEGAAVLGDLIGWVPKSHVRAHEQENASLKARIEQLEAELQEADKFREAVNYLSKDGQMKPYAKSGRPKKEIA